MRDHILYYRFTKWHYRFTLTFSMIVGFLPIPGPTTRQWSLESQSFTSFTAVFLSLKVASSGQMKSQNQLHAVIFYWRATIFFNVIFFTRKICTQKKQGFLWEENLASINIAMSHGWEWNVSLTVQVVVQPQWSHIQATKILNSITWPLFLKPLNEPSSG